MELKIIGSGSSGNAYALIAENSILLIEAGCRLMEVKKAIDFKLSKVEGLIYSHQHLDHGGYALDYAKAGIDVYSSPEALMANNVFQFAPHRAKPVFPTMKYRIKEFVILPFNVCHDVTTYGFLIQHPEMGLTCFVTDSMYSPAVFPGLNNILVEANYQEDVLDNNILSGKTNQHLATRIRNSHMSFDTTINFLQANDLSKVNNIVLLHLSNNNSNQELMKSKLHGITTQQIHIAEAGTTIQLNKTLF